MKKVIIFISVFFCFSQAYADSNTLKLVDTILKNTVANTVDMSMKVIEMQTNISSSDKVRMEKIIKEEANSKLYKLKEAYIPLYEKFYSPDEIQQLLSFYQTPTGKKSLRIALKLQMDAATIGAKWGASLSPGIRRKLQTQRLNKYMQFFP